MNHPTEHPNIHLETITVPKKMLDARLDSDEVIAVRDAFFADVRQQLETQISHGILEDVLRVRRFVSPPFRGRSSIDTDVSDELFLKHGQSVAFALETREFEAQRVVQFGVYPINKLGRRALEALIEADALINNAAFDE